MGSVFALCSAQTINILIINQSVIDMCASFFTLMTATVEVDGTHMRRVSVWDQFVCRVWLTRAPLWVFLVTSTYGILTTALERYFAVVYPVWYNVRMSIDDCVLRSVYRERIYTIRYDTTVYSVEI